MRDINVRYFIKLYVDISDISGQGLFAGEKIAKGEIILSFGGTLALQADRYSGKYMSSTFVGISETVMLCETSDAEKDFSDRLMRERIKQYESSKSNIEIINKKCHDLKYQILAIENENIETTERVRLLEEAKNALMIYDCAVNTDNETLNTILNEKSLFCAEQGIRLSCTIKTAQLDKINVVDLFTMLGNMLDEYISAGLSEFEMQDDTPVALKALLYNRFCHWQMADTASFKGYSKFI